MSTKIIAPEWSTGDRIRKARRLAGLTQEQLGQMLGVTGPAVDNWEAGRNPVTPERLDRLDRVLAKAARIPRGWVAGADPYPHGGGVRKRGFLRRTDLSTCAPSEFAIPA